MNTDEKVIEWVTTKYPSILWKMTTRSLEEYIGKLRFSRSYMGDIKLLSLLVAYPMPSDKVYSKWSSKRYTRFVRGLKKHIKHNPDVIAFALL